MIVPLLTLILGLSIREAIALSLLSIVAISSSATITYSSSKYIDYKIGLILESTTVLGAFAGARLSIILDQRLLTVLFGILLIYAGYRMVKKIEIRDRGEDYHLSRNKIITGIMYWSIQIISSRLYWN